MPQSRYGSTAIGIIVVLIAAVIILGLFSIRVVNVGEVGVISTFGVVDPSPRAAGLLVKAPWQTLDTFSVRTQQITMSTTAEELTQSDQTVRTLTAEGLTVGIDMTTLYKLDFSQAPDVRRTLGPEGIYQEILVRPSIRDAIRDVVAQFSAEALYTTARTQVSNQILVAIQETFGDRIIVENVLLRDVGLPAVITQAIEAKLAAEQAIQERRFRVEEAVQEAQRKREEAQGIADANRIVNESLTAAVLQDKYITALRDLDSGSVVYVPTNPDTGLPVILGTPSLGG
jgi:regulator of protease activity HflC (stomatin/prohibitin superfamily)